MIASFVILPIVIPILINVLHRYDDKVKESAKKPGKEYSAVDLVPRTIIYSIILGVMHAYYLYPRPKMFLFAAAFTAGVFVVMIAPKFIFNLFLFGFMGMHFVNIFFELDPANQSFLPITFSVLMFFTGLLIAPVNKTYNLFYKWNKTFSLTPTQVKKAMRDARFTDSRELAENDFFYSETKNEAELNLNSALFFKVKDKIKNYRTGVFGGVQMSDPAEISRRIETTLLDLERRFIRTRRDFVYFIIIACAIYLVQFIVTYFGRVFE
ncbi:MAG: hypothetical protein SCALA702_17360 [Melioribacteraceae bacterium]|nr:MAG: hypothetical protein SCALA702_17360 [Melioribacteraceae bacterium]